jgi:type IV secretory pathway VirB2 component (pilin)
MMPLSDPSGAQPLLEAARWALPEAARWVENVLLGSTAMVVATLAVATLGFLMLRGQVPFRRGASVLVGCFVLFGAHTLAQGIMDVAGGDDLTGPVVLAGPSGVPPPVVATSPAQPQVYDPYAGASVLGR